jgi:SET domain-containing protein
MTKKYPRLKRKIGLYLKDTGAKGRGVFCDHDIRPGEILEVTPALLLNERDTGFSDRTRLKDYTFTVGRLSKELSSRRNLKDKSGASCVILGIISFCNHSARPNAEVLWEEKHGTVYHSLRAIRKIPKHTEICTSYGRGWFGDRAQKPS